MEQQLLKGKTAIVTGGASGIGAAVVRRMAGEGASVVIADPNPRGKDAEKEWQDQGLSVEWVPTDVSRREQVADMVKVAEDRFGGLDILVNCAGVYPRGNLQETTDELWGHIMDVNLKGPFLACQEAFPAFIRRGGGCIVNIGSLNAHIGQQDLFAYSISKGGLLTMTRHLSAHLAPYRIRVNSVTPGWVLTEGELQVQKVTGSPEEWAREQGRKMPLGRMQMPEDIAEAVLFLASDEAGQITGQDLSVDGGLRLLSR